MTSDQVLGFRLARHRLDRRAPAGSMLEVVRELCGVHAQLASSAELALWARVEGLRRDDVRDALEGNRTLVKTWAMRGTLHLVPAEELDLYVAALGPRWDTVTAGWLRGFRITRAEYDAIVESVPRALDGRPRTREQLADRVGELAGPSVRDHLVSGWGSLLKPSAHRGELCFGPNRGRNVTFVRPDRWLRRPLRVDREGGAREFAHRFLSTYGPVGGDDFVRWIGSPTSAPKRLLTSLEDEVAEVSMDRRTALLRTADVPALRRARKPRGVRLLPAFDPYVVGSRPRVDFVAKSYEPRIFRPQGWISPVLLVDGRAVGIWGLVRRGRSVEVRVEPFGRLAASTRRGVEAEAELLGAFLELPAELTLA